MTRSPHTAEAFLRNWRPMISRCACRAVVERTTGASSAAAGADPSSAWPGSEAGSGAGASNHEGRSCSPPHGPRGSWPSPADDPAASPSAGGNSGGTASLT